MITKVEPGTRARLADIDPAGKGHYEGKDDPRVAADLARYLARLVELQERLMAEGKQSLLVILQALDAAGKDGVLKKVAGPLDSRGVFAWSYKAPVGDEATHDYLWRVHQRTPRKGEIAFFNRSHYEEVLVVRVFDFVPRERWHKRYEHIRGFEQMLVDEGTKVVKLYLHISKEEQRARLQERLDIPEKNWKFDPSDLKTRARWHDFQAAYEDAFAETSTESAPWYIVPADRKWARDLAVAKLLVETLEAMNPQFPKPSYDPKTITIDP